MEREQNCLKHAVLDLDARKGQHIQKGPILCGSVCASVNMLSHVCIRMTKQIHSNERNRNSMRMYGDFTPTTFFTHVLFSSFITWKPDSRSSLKPITHMTFFIQSFLISIENSRFSSIVSWPFLSACFVEQLSMCVLSPTWLTTPWGQSAGSHHLYIQIVHSAFHIVLLRYRVENIGKKEDGQKSQLLRAMYLFSGLRGLHATSPCVKKSFQGDSSSVNSFGRTPS